MGAVLRCVSANTKRRSNVAKRKGKKMPSKKKRAARTSDVPAPPDPVAYSQALRQGKTRSEAMAVAHKKGAEIVAEKAARLDRAAAYRR